MRREGGTKSAREGGCYKTSQPRRHPQQHVCLCVYVLPASGLGAGMDGMQH